MRRDRSLIVFFPKDDNQVRMVVTTKQLVLDEIDDIEILKEKYQRTSLFVFFFKNAMQAILRSYLFVLPFCSVFFIHLTDTTVFLWGMYKEETVNSVHNIFEQNKKQKHGGKKIEELFLN